MLRLAAVGLLIATIQAALDAPRALGQTFRSDFGSVLSAVERGLIIADGVYLNPPYRIELADGVLVINGLTFEADDFQMAEFEQVEDWRHESRFIERERYVSWGSRRGDGWRRSRQMRMPDPIEQLWDNCRSTAQMDGVVVLSHGQAPLLLDRSGAGNDLLVALLRKSGGAFARAQAVEIPAELTDAQHREAWDHAVAEFRPSREFHGRAGAYVAQVLDANDKGERVVKASLWADSISYPLTLFAMIVVVVAFGHLLSNKPRLEEGLAGAAVSPETQKVVLKSLLIFGLLSIVDLIWTLCASATGTMREMNPLGHELIDDPIRLIAFKVIAVSLTIVLLYTLHRRPIAQVASWWSCLVLTLLTARWLTFNSMFM